MYHRYNQTWKNERCIESPLVKSIVDSERGKILEIGNVLSHYYTAAWDVLDKFDKGKNIINEDIAYFNPQNKYDLIISISTFEHIGFDDDLSGFKNSAVKIEKSFNNTFNNALKNNGKIVISAPIGYNPDMDRIIFGNKLKFDEQYFYMRITDRKWVQVNEEEAVGTKFNSPFQYANCIFIGIKKKKELRQFTTKHCLIASSQLR